MAARLQQHSVRRSLSVRRVARSLWDLIWIIEIEYRRRDATLRDRRLAVERMGRSLKTMGNFSTVVYNGTLVLCCTADTTDVEV